MKTIKKKNNLLIHNFRIYLFILFSVALIAGGYLFYQKALYKYNDLTLRFRMIEQKIVSIGTHIAGPIAAYQAQRGDAPIGFLNQEPNNIGLWTELDTPWEAQRYVKTKALSKYGNNLVVGLLGHEAGDAAVYSFNGQWKILGSSKITPQWKNLSYVQVLREFDGKLFAGIDHQVWMYDKVSTSWNKVGENANGFPWGHHPATAYNLVVHNSQLYVGIMDKQPEVYRLAGDYWEKVSDGLPTDDEYLGVYETWHHSDGKLYASLATELGHSTSVYVFNDERMFWTKIGGQGLNGSWINNGLGYGTSFSSHNSWLILTTSRHPMAPGHFSSVWGYDGNEWYPIGASNAPLNEWKNINAFNASLSMGDNLYIGSGGHPAGQAIVWQYTSQGWTLVGGRGVRGSWGAEFPHTLTSSLRHTDAEYPYRMIEWKNKMVVGFGDAIGAAKLYLYDPQPH
ncbi:hypothetical protein [Candidatus Pelagibacter communis]|jgi:hypothetical protein|uniref:hypothetical protein n=1 Tax=Pelagibacter ubique TaxID=198252 RepID=UPI00036D7BEE|nr:hypothetical protein [Candidatus Pelagibacter ubique]